METLSTSPTVKEYLSDTYKFTSQDVVIQLSIDIKDNSPIILLKNTIFHPQGGGQPSDSGVIEKYNSENDKIIFMVKELIYDKEKDQIWHKGQYDPTSKGQFQINDTVNIKIDEVKHHLTNNKGLTISL